MSKKFRPQYFDGKWKLKNNPVGHYNWIQRRKCDNFILRTCAVLHYLADHAPLPIQKKWRNAWQQFAKKYSKKI